VTIAFGEPGTKLMRKSYNRCDFKAQVRIWSDALAIKLHMADTSVETQQIHSHAGRYLTAQALAAPT
jgi:hypothetical protein